MSGESGHPNPSPDSESLVKRLAGPSTTKAGLAKDQTEINRVIAEASKGSKFYENEKRKDKDLTDRIVRILKYRDEVTKGIDLRAIEQGVDQLLVTLECQRDLTQIIVHVDMDAFYANVELLDKPDLRGKPFAVGKGVLTTASYEARKYGVRSGMPVFIAKKLCPDLILVENHFHRYMEMSKRVMDIFRQYDPTMCAAGCDEGYLNITIYCEDRQLTAEECVQEMRETVHKETRLTVSAGIAPNKMLAKICSDKNKPNGQFKLDFEPGAIRAFMKDLSIRKVPGVGRVNERLLDSIGIKTCGDIYTHRAILSLMDKHFGLHFLLQAYLGIASNIVQPGQREERKSIGAERTFTPIADKDRILQKLEEVAAELESDMINGGWTGKTVTLKYKLDTYQVFTRAKSFDKWISTKKEDLFTMGKELLTPELPLTLRLIGLRVTKLKDLRVQPKLSGIERFFEFSTSPTKKRRVEVDYVPLHEDQASLAQDGYQDAMPGYFEHAELDDEVGASLDLLNDIQDRNDIAPNDEVITLDVETSPSSEQGSTQTLERERQRPPNSAPLPSSGSASTSRPLKPISSLAKTPQGLHHTSMGSSSERNMRSANRRSPSHPTEGKSADRAGAVEAQTCPICEKLIETDNQGFNTHIDFCLSKKAIREAQASASVPMQQSPLSVKGTPARKKFVGREVATRKKRKR